MNFIYMQVSLLLIAKVINVTLKQMGQIVSNSSRLELHKHNWFINILIVVLKPCDLVVVISPRLVASLVLHHLAYREFPSRITEVCTNYPSLHCHWQLSFDAIPHQATPHV